MDRIAPIGDIGLKALPSINLTNFNDDMYILEQKKADIVKEIEEMDKSSTEDLKQREMLELELKLKMIELQLKRMQEAAKIAVYNQEDPLNADKDNSLTVEISNESLQLCLESMQKEDDFSKEHSEQRKQNKEKQEV